MKKQLVVNLYGGPGSGKSTQAAAIFAALKKQGINAELSTEYAKDLTYQESMKVLGNQIYVFAKQHMRLWRSKGLVDVIITDSPLLLCTVYNASTHSDTFRALVREQYDAFDNINVFLKRPNVYKNHGRTQTLEEAMELDRQISETVVKNNFAFDLVHTANDEAADMVVAMVRKRLGIDD